MDADNHLAAVEYVEDVYNFYKLTEVYTYGDTSFCSCVFCLCSIPLESYMLYMCLIQDESRVNDYMEFQPELNHKMRAILVDWLIEVHRKFELMPESLYLTINILDRFLSMKTVPRRELQLVGISSMLIACKYEEIWAPEVYYYYAVHYSVVPIGTRI